ncbi:uncharacterized protein LOC136074160 [Hydra vulgaris]|uniref:Uncharacterized protein LOC136074160 n=1 Tax=Hydra vulgaris TaxID=6087 RepID=A0ABM4B198_HYDVU
MLSSTRTGQFSFFTIFLVLYVILDKATTELLNLGLKFVPLQRKILYMDIITNVEMCTLRLEKQGKSKQAESLKRNCSKILTNSFKLRLKDNLTKQQRISIRKLKMTKDIRIYSFDKGTGFALLYEINACLKLEEKIKNTRIIDHDPHLLPYFKNNCVN